MYIIACGIGSKIMQVLLAKWGNSLGLRLPRALAAELGVSEGQKVELRAENGRLIVEPVRQIFTWAQMMENVTPEAMRDAFDWGDDVGRERVDE
jgi:antitoxin MazE